MHTDSRAGANAMGCHLLSASRLLAKDAGLTEPSGLHHVNVMQQVLQAYMCSQQIASVGPLWLGKLLEANSRQGARPKAPWLTKRSIADAAQVAPVITLMHMRLPIQAWLLSPTALHTDQYPGGHIPSGGVGDVCQIGIRIGCR